MRRERIKRLKFELLEGSGISLLQAIDDVSRLCRGKQRYSNSFYPLIERLTENSHPWVKKRAKKCLKILIKNKDASESESNKEKSSLPEINTLGKYIDLLLKMLKNKPNFRDKLLDLYKNTNHYKTNYSNNVKDQLFTVVKNPNANYLRILFNLNDIKYLVGRMELEYNDYDDINSLCININKKLGIRIDRGDYLEL